jgi:hypothetical protein
MHVIETQRGNHLFGMHSAYNLNAGTHGRIEARRAETQSPG